MAAQEGGAGSGFLERTNERTDLTCSLGLVRPPTTFTQQHRGRRGIDRHAGVTGPRSPFSRPAPNHQTGHKGTSFAPPPMPKNRTPALTPTHKTSAPSSFFSSEPALPLLPQGIESRSQRPQLGPQGKLLPAVDKGLLGKVEGGGKGQNCASLFLHTWIWMEEVASVVVQGGRGCKMHWTLTPIWFGGPRTTPPAHPLVFFERRQEMNSHMLHFLRFHKQ